VEAAVLDVTVGVNVGAAVDVAVDVVDFVENIAVDFKM
jgi:hypothetical protein